MGKQTTAGSTDHREDLPAVNRVPVQVSVLHAWTPGAAQTPAPSPVFTDASQVASRERGRNERAGEPEARLSPLLPSTLLPHPSSMPQEIGFKRQPKTNPGRKAGPRRKKGTWREKK